MSRPPDTATPPPDRPARTWVVREGTTGDRAAVLDCRRACFAGEELEKQEVAYWDWEFVHNHAGPARHFLAEDGDRAVGWYAVIPQHFQLDGERLHGSIVVDVMTHPDYRFQGMFTALGRASIETCSADPKLDFTTGYPIRPEVIPGHLKVGWKARFTMGVYAMPLSVGVLLGAQVPKLSKVPLLGALIGAIPTAVLRANAKLRLNADASYRVERREACDHARLGAFWETMRARLPKGCVVQERTPEFLSWRYDQNPGRDYRYYLALDPQGAISGYLVTRRLIFEGVSAMVIADALALPSERDAVLHTLIAAARADALADRCAVMALTVTQPNPLFPKPSSLGFVPAPAKFTFITREYTDACPVIDNDVDWHLMYGDTDDI